MLFMVVGVNSEVINIYENKFVFQPHESYVHVPLENGPRIHHPKWHFCIHEGALGSGKHSFFLVIRVHTNLVVSKETIQE